MQKKTLTTTTENKRSHNCYVPHSLTPTEVTITTFNDNQALTVFIAIALLLFSLSLSKEHQVKFAASCESSE